MVEAMLQAGRLSVLESLHEESDLAEMQHQLIQWKYVLDEWSEELHRKEQESVLALIGPAASDKHLRSHELNSFVLNSLSRSKRSVSENLQTFGYQEVHRGGAVLLTGLRPGLADIQLSDELDVGGMDCPLFNHLLFKFENERPKRVSQGGTKRARRSNES